MQEQKRSLVKVITRINTKEGITGFYKGLTPALSTVPLVNAVVFSSYELAKRGQGIEDNQEETFRQSIVAGSFAGFVNSFVVGPIELVKCRLQM